MTRVFETWKRGEWTDYGIRKWAKREHVDVVCMHDEKGIVMDSERTGRRHTTSAYSMHAGSSARTSYAMTRSPSPYISEDRDFARVVATRLLSNDSANYRMRSHSTELESTSSSFEDEDGLRQTHETPSSSILSMRPYGRTSNGHDVALPQRQRRRLFGRYVAEERNSSPSHMYLDPALDGDASSSNAAGCTIEPESEGAPMRHSLNYRIAIYSGGSSRELSNSNLSHVPTDLWRSDDGVSGSGRAYATDGDSSHCNYQAFDSDTERNLDNQTEGSYSRQRETQSIDNGGNAHASNSSNWYISDCIDSDFCWHNDSADEGFYNDPDHLRIPEYGNSGGGEDSDRYLASSTPNSMSHPMLGDGGFQEGILSSSPPELDHYLGSGLDQDDHDDDDEDHADSAEDDMWLHPNIDGVGHTSGQSAASILQRRHHIRWQGVGGALMYLGWTPDEDSGGSARPQPESRFTLPHSLPDDPLGSVVWLAADRHQQQQSTTRGGRPERSRCHLDRSMNDEAPICAWLAPQMPQTRSAD